MDEQSSIVRKASLLLARLGIKPPLSLKQRSKMISRLISSVWLKKTKTTQDQSF